MIARVLLFETEQEGFLFLLLSEKSNLKWRKHYWGYNSNYLNENEEMMPAWN